MSTKLLMLYLPVKFTRNHSSTSQHGESYLHIGRGLVLHFGSKLAVKKQLTFMINTQANPFGTPPLARLSQSSVVVLTRHWEILFYWRCWLTSTESGFQKGMHARIAGPHSNQLS